MRLWTLARSMLIGLALLAVFAVFVLGWLTSWDLKLFPIQLIQVWTDYSKVVDWIYDLIDRTARFIVPIATIGGAVYGIYHKWQYGKSRMHIHIQEFLKRDDKRLTPTGRRLQTLVDRPGPSRDFVCPIFSAVSLEPALKQMRWGALPEAKKALSVELTKLNQQLDVWGDLEGNYNRHKAQAHLVQGAIAAARAASAAGRGEPSRDDDTEAFENFKAAYELNKADDQALEYMAHQRVRLGDLANALIDYASLQKSGETRRDGLSQARALKFQATVREIEGAARLAQDESLRPHQEPNLLKARDLLTEALEILPDTERGGLEEAELYELRGRVHKKRERFNVSTNDLTTGERLYDRLTKQTNGRDIRKSAQSGLERVRAALQEIRLRPLPSPDTVPEGSDDEPPLVAANGPIAELPQLPTTSLTAKPTA